MARLIDNLELLGRGALPQLKRICGVDDEDMADMIRELRAYDPKPGLKYGSDISQAIVPDLFVMERAGGWSIEINNATLPRRSEEHTSELQSLMRSSYAVFCLKNNINNNNYTADYILQTHKNELSHSTDHT